MRARTRARGLTLIEVLVSTVILTVLGVALTRVYDLSRVSYATGVGRVALQQRARIAVQRLTPRLVRAIPPTETSPAISSPAPLDPATSEISYSIPAEDLDPRSPTYRTERLYFQASSGRLFLDPGTSANPVDDLLLARDLDQVLFEVLSQNAVRLTVKVRGKVRTADNRSRDQEFRLQTVVQIPFYTTK